MGMRSWGMVIVGAVVALAPLAGPAGDAAADERGKGAAIEWTRDYTTAFKEAKATGRPILLNFYCGT